MNEFDKFSDTYAELLHDPLRDIFSARSDTFFHVRKRDLIRRHFEKRHIDSRQLDYLDVGCGRGELASLLRNDFARVCGCDPSIGMMRRNEMESPSVETCLQEDPMKIPFPDETFDFVTAACVYHHVPVGARAAITLEARRVLRPGGWFAIIEHNPLNPVTRLIVSRTPVDADAVLLRPVEAQKLLKACEMEATAPEFFLYFPERLYSRFGLAEPLLARIPLGGQYVVYGHKARRVTSAIV